MPLRAPYVPVADLRFGPGVPIPVQRTYAQRLASVLALVSRDLTRLPWDWPVSGPDPSPRLTNH